MNKILNYIMNNLFTVALIIIVIALAFNNHQVLNGQDNQISNRVLQSKQELDLSNSEEDIVDLISAPDDARDPSLYPHGSCFIRLTETAVPSEIYVPFTDYDLSFAYPGYGPTFQDINGDNLPDYIWVSTTYGGSPTQDNIYRSCVYLNNGHGWDKVHECIAHTQVDLNSNTIISRQYRGDCAG